MGARSKRESNRAKYLQNCTRTIRGQIGLPANPYQRCESIEDILAVLTENKREAIFQHLLAAPDDQIGRLACNVDIAQVRHLATRAVMLAMAGQIFAGRPLARADSEGFVLEVSKARFKDWEGIDFLLYVTKPGGPEQRVQTRFFLDKDDPICTQLDLCKSGENFLHKDSKAAAAALARTFHPHAAVAGAKDHSETNYGIYVAGKLLFHWDCMSHKLSEH